MHCQSIKALMPHNVIFKPIKKYSTDYMKSFRFRNRGYNAFADLKDYLLYLGIWKFFDTKRGTRAGKWIKSLPPIRSIKSITSNVRKPRSSIMEPRPCYLLKVPIATNHYCFPSIFITNLRSIANKFDQLCVAAETYKPGIILLTETWLNESNQNAFAIDGYNSFHRIRNRDDKSHGGGVSAYISKNITIQQHNMSIIAKIEVLSIVCKPKYLPRDIPWIGIILVYFPPNVNNESDVMAYVIGEYDRLMAINSKAGIMIAGDFNSMNILPLLRLPKLKQMINLPTRGDSYLDLCLSNLSDMYSVQVMPPIAGSDHKLLFISPVQQTLPRSSKTIVTYRKRTESGYRLMANILSCHDWSQWSLIDSVQDKADIFYDFINYLYLIAFPLITETKRANSHPWMNGVIARMIRDRDLLNNNADSLAYKNLCDRIKNEIAVAKNLVCRNLYTKFKSSPREFYDMIKRLTNSTVDRSNINIIFPGSNADDSLRVICEYFGGLLTVHPKGSFGDGLVLDDNSTLPEMDLFSIYRQLKNLPNNNACAPGDVPSHIYKELAEFLAEPLLLLINSSLKELSVPSQWKVGYLITIPKVTLVKSPSQLRPIIISSPIAKIIEKHILSIVKSYCIDFIDPMQFGGLQKRSTCQYLSIYLHRVAMQLELKGSSITSIFTDFEKAFDSIDHDVLIKNMIRLSINTSAIKWIIDFLSQRKTVLRDSSFNDSLSFVSTCGIPQGSVLGGFLFILVIDNLMRNYPLRLKYMDDLTISLVDVSSDNSLIQNALEDLMLQSNELKMKLNINKCFVMHHSVSRVTIYPVAMIGDSQLKLVDSFRLLGVIIQSDIRWNEHINNIITKVNKKIFMFYMLRRLGANREIMVDVFKTFVRPIIEYCAPVWHPAITKIQCRSIEQLQKRIVRVIMGNDHVNYINDLHSLGLQSLEERRVNIHFRFAVDFFKCFPEFLPKTTFQTTGIQTRSSNRYVKPKIRTNRANKSPIISFINICNCNL